MPPCTLELLEQDILTSPAGVFIYDNQLYPGSSQPSFTLYGLLFTTGTLGTSDYKEINLYSDGAAQNDYHWCNGLKIQVTVIIRVPMRKAHPPFRFQEQFCYLHQVLQALLY